MNGVQPKCNPSILEINEEGDIAFVSGHNIVIQNAGHRGDQRFIQGVDGCEAITAMALHPNKKFLAVAERATQAICIIYDITTLKRKKICTTGDCVSKSFTSLAFANSDQKSEQFLVTLTGEPDYRAIIWLWEKQKFYA